MKPAKALFIVCLVGSSRLMAENVEERAWSVSSLLMPNIFQLNPANISTEKTIFSGLRLTKNEESKYRFNPNSNNPTSAQHKTEKKDIALGFQLPLGGASFGLAADEYSRKVSGRTDARTTDLVEEFWTRDYKMRFVVDLLPELRAGFTFRYQSLEADLLGAYNLNNLDHTRYKGTMSGYSLGVNYRIQAVSLSALTAPPLRGKATIEGEQKIISDPGLGAIELGFSPNDQQSLTLVAMKWTYKHDDRDDETTSPIDQRNIFLRGIDLDQFYRKTLAVALGAEFALTPVIGFKGSYVRQDGVFLFDGDKVPGDDDNAETKIRSNEFRAGAFLRNKQFFAELLLTKTQRSKDTIKVNRGELNLRELGSYKHTDSSTLLVLGGAF